MPKNECRKKAAMHVTLTAAIKHDQSRALSVLTSRSCVIASFWRTMVVCFREVVEILFSSSFSLSWYSVFTTCMQKKAQSMISELSSDFTAKQHSRPQSSRSQKLPRTQSFLGIFGSWRAKAQGKAPLFLLYVFSPPHDPLRQQPKIPRSAWI